MSTEHPTPYPIDDLEDALDVLAPSLTDKLAAARKALTGLLGLLAQLVSHGVLHGTALDVTSTVLAAGTALGVYQVRNVPLPDPAADAVAEIPPHSDRTPDQGPDGQHLPEHAAGD